MKRTLLLVLGIGVLFVTSAQAQFYELSYGGPSFFGSTDIEDYYHTGNYASKESSIGTLDCQVVFPASASGMNVSRLSVTYLDNTNGYITVSIIKIDRWTGNYALVAIVVTSGQVSLPSVRYVNQPKSQMIATGIDNNRYSWYLWANFTESGDSLRIYSVTVRYQ